MCLRFRNFSVKIFLLVLVWFNLISYVIAMGKLTTVSHNGIFDYFSIYPMFSEMSPEDFKMLLMALILILFVVVFICITIAAYILFSFRKFKHDSFDNYRNFSECKSQFNLSNTNTTDSYCQTDRSADLFCTSVYYSGMADYGSESTLGDRVNSIDNVPEFLMPTVKLSDIPIRSRIDTGSEHSLISEECFSQLGQNFGGKFLGSTVTLQTISGQILSGRLVQIPLEWKGQFKMQNFVIVKNLPVPVLLGIDMLTAFEASINFGHHKNFPQPQKMQGIVKWFNVVKGYGFIICDNTQREIFVHKTGIVRDPGTFNAGLDNGEAVEFNIVQTRKGDEARDVTGPGGSNVIGSCFATDFNRGRCTQVRNWSFPTSRAPAFGSWRQPQQIAQSIPRVPVVQPEVHREQAVSENVPVESPKVVVPSSSNVLPNKTPVSSESLPSGSRMEHVPSEKTVVKESKESTDTFSLGVYKELCDDTINKKWSIYDNCCTGDDDDNIDLDYDSDTSDNAWLSARKFVGSSW